MTHPYPNFCIAQHYELFDRRSLFLKMVQSMNGLLLTCKDQSIKETLLFLDSQYHFIIEDLDENHLFIEASQYEKVKEELDKLLAQNTFTRVEESHE